MDRSDSIIEKRIIHSLIRKSLDLLKLNQNVEVFEEFIHSRFGNLQFKLEVNELNSGGVILEFSVIKHSEFFCDEGLCIGTKKDIISFLEMVNSNPGLIIEKLPELYRFLFFDD